MLQSWLVFGLLESILRIQISSSSFIRDTANGRIIDTTAFRRVTLPYLTQFHRKICEIPEVEAICRENLIRTLKFSERWNRALLFETRCSPDLQEIYDSIIGLGAMLSETLFGLQEQLSKSHALAFPLLRWHLTRTHLQRLEKRMLRKGWCRSTHSAILEMGVSVAEYACLVGPSDEKDNEHDNCSSEKCIVNDVDVTLYQPIHVDAGCTCSFYRPDIGKLKHMLMNGQIPLLNSERIRPTTSTRTIYEEWVAHEEHARFIAFSHVWAHGCGSDAESGLPLCQIQRLQTFILNVKAMCGIESSLFWIDSLCIPKDRKPRARAIQLMSKIYSNCAVTIGLDKNMMKFNYHPSLIDRFLFRLALSDWNRRLWTLQEAHLSTNLVVITLERMVHLQNALGASFGNDIRTALASTVSQAHAKIEVGDFKLIGNVAMALNHRSTSKPSDETLVTAPLLGVETGQLIGLNGDERIIQLWRSIRRVPRDVILIGNSERVCQVGFRWLPRTFMTGLVIQVSTRADATVTDSGLIATYDILRFEKRILSPCLGGGILIAVDEQAGHFYHISGFQFMTHGELLIDAIAFTDRPSMSGVSYMAVSLTAEDSVDACPRYAYRGIHAVFLRPDDAPVIQGWGHATRILCHSVETKEVLIT